MRAGNSVASKLIIIFGNHPFLWNYLSNLLSYYLQTNAHCLRLPPRWPRFKFCPVSWTPYCHLWFRLWSVNLALYCLPEGPPAILRLPSKGPHSAVLVDLNTHTTDGQTGAARCRLEVTAPPGHKLTVHLDHPKAFPNRTSEKRNGVPPCFLKLVSICDTFCYFMFASGVGKTQERWAWGFPWRTRLGSNKVTVDVGVHCCDS